MIRFSTPTVSLSLRQFVTLQKRQKSTTTQMKTNAKKKNIFGIDSQKQIKNLLQYSRTMKGDVLCCNTHQNLSEVTDLLSLYNVSSLLVVHPELTDRGQFMLQDILKADLKGIITERDIARCKHVSQKETLVKDIMCDKVYHVDSEETVAQTVEKMLKLNLRHVPVVQTLVHPIKMVEDEWVIGFLSLKDILHGVCYEQRGGGIVAMISRGMFGNDK